ncbi:MAG: NAD(P)/FAD-dependent oxidoreductase [Bacteroidales bacterium]|nr:NAD(P)/FAD-dependent oxidoreductase [Bacteroidales bacterium]
MIRNNIIIIGSGLGGLLSGYLLSKESLRVTVLEKRRKFGGCLQTFKRDKYIFDTGMHYIGSLEPGQPLYNYWKYFGLTGKLNLLQMDPDGFDRISFGYKETSGIIQEFPLAQGFDNFRDRLLPYFPGAESALTSYTKKLDEIAHSHPLYNLELPSTNSTEHYSSIKAFDFLNDLASGIRDIPLPRPPEFPGQALPSKGGEYPASRIQDPGSGISLSNVLAGNNFLYAGNPATTPLSQFGLINHSFISSAWRLAGGSQQIANILVEGIRVQGGEVVAKKKVISIGQTGERFTIETADGDRFEAAQIVSDIHPAVTLHLLDGIPVQKAYRERITSLENTISVFTVYLGLKPDTFPFLNHNVYHHISSSVWTDAGSRIPDNRRPMQFLFMTPPEKDQGPFANTAVVMTPMLFEEVREWEKSDAGAREKSYFVFKARKAKQLLDQVYRKFPDLKESVATIDISTPLTWRDYTGTPEGSMYGIVKDATHPQKTIILPTTKIPGLFFTGQSVNLHGALGVTIGAVMTCGEMLGMTHVMENIKRAL